MEILQETPASLVTEHLVVDDRARWARETAAERKRGLPFKILEEILVRLAPATVVGG